MSFSFLAKRRQAAREERTSANRCGCRRQGKQKRGDGDSWLSKSVFGGRRNEVSDTDDGYGFYSRCIALPPTNIFLRRVFLRGTRHLRIPGDARHGRGGESKLHTTIMRFTVTKKEGSHGGKYYCMVNGTKAIIRRVRKVLVDDLSPHPGAR